MAENHHAFDLGTKTSTTAWKGWFTIPHGGARQSAATRTMDSNRWAGGAGGIRNWILNSENPGCTEVRFSRKYHIRYHENQHPSFGLILALTSTSQSRERIWPGYDCRSGYNPALRPVGTPRVDFRKGETGPHFIRITGKIRHFIGGHNTFQG